MSEGRSPPALPVTHPCASGQGQGQEQGGASRPFCADGTAGYPGWGQLGTGGREEEEEITLRTRSMALVVIVTSTRHLRWTSLLAAAVLCRMLCPVPHPRSGSHAIAAAAARCNEATVPRRRPGPVGGKCGNCVRHSGDRKRAAPTMAAPSQKGGFSPQAFPPLNGCSKRGVLTSSCTWSSRFHRRPPRNGGSSARTRAHQHTHVRANGRTGHSRPSAQHVTPAAST